ncbi:PQQ-binding-like beta-propeller repeat protein [Haladaptatus sp. DFWS20]
MNHWETTGDVPAAPSISDETVSVVSSDGYVYSFARDE